MDLISAEFSISTSNIMQDLGCGTDSGRDNSVGDGGDNGGGVASSSLSSTAMFAGGLTFIVSRPTPESDRAFTLAFRKSWKSRSFFLEVLSSPGLSLFQNVGKGRVGHGGEIIS